MAELRLALLGAIYPMAELEAASLAPQPRRVDQLPRERKSEKKGKGARLAAVALAAGSCATADGQGKSCGSARGRRAQARWAEKGWAGRPGPAGIGDGEKEGV